MKAAKRNDTLRIEISILISRMVMNIRNYFGWPKAIEVVWAGDEVGGHFTISSLASASAIESPLTGNHKRLPDRFPSGRRGSASALEIFSDFFASIVTGLSRGLMQILMNFERINNFDK